jgi:hypothetical protein
MCCILSIFYFVKSLNSIEECVLLALSQNPELKRDYSITTEEYTLSNALDFARKTILDFEDLVKNKRVLDYGCVPGEMQNQNVKRPNQ